LDYEHVSIETPEHVSISYELAGPGSRLIAALLDHLLILLIVVAILLLCAALNAQLPASSAPAIVVMIVIGGPLILLCLYFILFETLWSGQTPGKRAAGLRVMRDDGTPVSTLDVLIRNTIRLIDFAPYLYFVGGLVAFIHKQSKRLGDLAAGTVVVKLRQSELPTSVEPGPSLPTETNGLLSLVRPLAGSLTPEELGMVQRFLERRFELAPDVRSQMARRVIDAVRARLSDEAAAFGDQDPEPLLEALAQACSRTGDRF